MNKVELYRVGLEKIKNKLKLCMLYRMCMLYYLTAETL